MSHSVQKNSIEYQDHVSTSKCSWASCQRSSQNQNQNKGKGKSKGQSKGKTKSKGKPGKVQWTTWSGNQSWLWSQGQGGKGKGARVVLTVVAKVIQQINAGGGLLKQVLLDQVQIIRDKCTISQLSLEITQLQSCPHCDRSICSEDSTVLPCLQSSFEDFALLQDEQDHPSYGYTLTRPKNSYLQ